MVQFKSLGKWNVYFTYYSIKHVTGIPYNPTGQTVIERSNRIKQTERGGKYPQE